MQKVNELKNNSKQIYGVPNGKKRNKDIQYTQIERETERKHRKCGKPVGTRRRLRVAYS